MVWFSSPGSTSGASWSFAKQNTAKPPETVSADRAFSVSKALGRSIPIVVGTAKVDGIPVIGGAVTTKVVTGYDQVELTTLQNLNDFPSGTKWLNNDPFSRIAEVPIYGTQQSAMLGYLLAFDPFGDGYKLVRIEVDNEVVYDAENGIGASVPFRFYGGDHTAVDPIATVNIGANAGAWQRFAMVYLAGVVSDNAPSVKAVISNAATEGGGTHEIAWTSTVPSVFTQNAAGRAAAYDPTQDVIYQLLGQNEIPGIAQVYLSVLDAVTHTERYRIPLEGSEAYASSSKWIHAIRGSGFVFVRFANPSAADFDRVYDATTGKIVSSYEEIGEIFDWKIGFPFGQDYILTGFDFGAGIGLPYALIDITGNIQVGRVADAGGGSLVYGRSTSGTVSFFICDTAGTVDEAVFNGDAWTTTTVYTSAGVPTGAWYDPQTGYLVVFETVAGAYFIRYVDPETGVTADSITVDRDYFITTGTNATGKERYWPRPGYVMMTEGLNDDGRVYLLNVGSKTITTFAENTAIDNIDFTTGIFDQNKQAYFQAFGDDVWTEYQLPNILPGLVSVEWMLTKLAFLVRYAPSELIFEGLGGHSGYGLGIYSNTNIRTVIQSVADIYGFSFADTGSGMYFKKPGRDATFALDAALTTADLVFSGDDPAVKSQDEATIRTVARVELEYISKEQGYTSRPASFAMPAVNNSIRVEQYSSALVLSDLDAQTFVTEKFFELQARRRAHSFSLIGKPAFLPGDVVSVPSGAITYAVQIDSVDLNRNMVADIQASDFQTAVSTTITAVTNTGFENVMAVTMATQYVHLDIPLFRYADDLGGTGLRQYGVVAPRGQSGWGGGILYRGDTATDLAALLSQAPHNGVLGICVTALGNPVDPFATTDMSTVTIRRTAGNAELLVDKTEAQVLAGANLAFIGAAGRWEGVGYKTVTDNGDGTYTLSGFTVRGYRGTEVFADLHQIGDQFVMIDPAWLKSVSHPVSDLDATKYYKAIGISQSPGTGTVFPHVIRGAAETPYACVNLDAVLGSPDGIDLSWDYRSRLAAGLNPANFGEATLAFEIDIIDTDGTTVLRTLTATTNSKHYATTDIVTDFGSDPPGELFFEVYMMSAVVGRGYRARHHVYFSGFGSPIGLLLALTKA